MDGGHGSHGHGLSAEGTKNEVKRPPKGLQIEILVCHICHAGDMYERDVAVSFYENMICFDIKFVGITCVLKSNAVSLSPSLRKTDARSGWGEVEISNC